MPMPFAHRGAAGGDIGQTAQPARRPFDGDRIGGDAAHVPLQSDGHVLVIDLALDEAVHRVQEILAVIARVKAQDVGRQHVQQHLALPRAHAEGLGIGPGDVPEQRDRRLRNLACGSAAAAARSGNPGSGSPDCRCSIRPPPHRQISRSLPRRRASRWRETPAAHRPGGTAATAPHWRSRSNSPAPVPR